METKEKFWDMDEELFDITLKHYFMPPIGIAQGNIHLALREADNPEQVKRMRQALDALNRIESVVHNMVEKGEIRE